MKQVLSISWYKYSIRSLHCKSLVQCPWSHHSNCFYRARCVWVHSAYVGFHRALVLATASFFSFATLSFCFSHSWRCGFMIASCIKAIMYWTQNKCSELAFFLCTWRRFLQYQCNTCFKGGRNLDLVCVLWEEATHGGYFSWEKVFRQLVQGISALWYFVVCHLIFNFTSICIDPTLQTYCLCWYVRVHVNFLVLEYIYGARIILVTLLYLC